MAQLTDQEFEAKWNLGFADNTMQDITEKTFRVFKADLKDSYANLRALNVRQVRGATYPLPYTDSVSQIPPAYRIVGMLALARVGTTAADAATQPTLPGPMRLRLVAAPDGDVDALVDEQPATTATVKAKWVTQPTVNLLTADNDWLGTNDFKRGLKLPNAVNFDDFGQLFVRRVDVDARLYLHNGRFSLAKDSLVQWKPDDYINQDGNADIGLARSGPGVLEVNTGTKGSPATLSAMDVVFQAAPPALNSGTKLAAAVLKKADLAANGTLVVAQLPDTGYGLKKNPSTGLYELDDKNLDLGSAVLPNQRVNPVNGAVIRNGVATGYETAVSLQIFPPGLSFVTPGQNYISNVALFYAAWYDVNGNFLRAWSTSTTDASFSSVAPANANFIKVSLPTGKILGTPVRIAPAAASQKLYKELGANEDGSLTQKASTDLFALKADKTDLIWKEVGTANSRNYALGTWSENNTLGAGSVRNLFFSNGDLQLGLNCKNNLISLGVGSVVLGDASTENSIGVRCLGVSFGARAQGNRLEAYCNLISGGNDVVGCIVEATSSQIVFGDASKYCLVSDGSQYVTFGANCQRVKVLGTKGTSAAPFAVAAGTTDATFINGVLQTAGSGVGTPTGTALVFTQDAEYPTLYSGTFTVDVTGAKAGAVVNVRLGASATAPTLSSSFVLLGDNTKAGDKKRYSFCVAPDNLIEYYVTKLP